MNLLTLFLKARRLMNEESPSIRGLSSDLHYHESYLSKLERGDYFSIKFFVEAITMLQIKKIELSDKNINILDFLVDDNQENTDILKSYLHEEEIKINSYLLIMINKLYDADIDWQAKNIDIEKIDLPYFLLGQYVQKSIQMKYFEEETLALEKILLKLIQQFDPLAQKLFYTVYLYKLITSAKYQEAMSIINKIQKIDLSNKKLDYLYHYYSLHVFIATKQPIDFMNTYTKLEKLIDTVPNIRRKLQLMNEYSRFLSSIHLENEAIEKLEEGANLSKDYDNDLYGTFNYNIGWKYSQLKEHTKAVKYYLEALPNSRDNTTYFEIAWNYYCLNDKLKCRKYINESKKPDVKIYKEYSTYFIQWLEAMCYRPYSRKSGAILEQIYKKFGDNMHYQSREFLLRRLIEYYLHINDKENALKYSLILNDMNA